MSIITSLTRMWLTRSTKPFIFKNEYDNVLSYQDCDNLGLYVHIPFCRSICNFCPYCKVRYSKDLCDRYIDALLREIHAVGGQQSGKKETNSLYFGGGTPALAADRLGEIIGAIKEHFVITEGIGVELHPDNVTPDVLRTLKTAGVTKISIGIQSFQTKFQSVLGRTSVDISAMKQALSEVPFETVSMDFIFALPNQTFEDLKADVDAAFQSGANHVAIYPFIDFTFTPSTVTTMPKKEKRELLDAITRYCMDQGYTRSSIWTFSSEADARYRGQRNVHSNSTAAKPFAEPTPPLFAQCLGAYLLIGTTSDMPRAGCSNLRSLRPRRIPPWSGRGPLCICGRR